MVLTKADQIKGIFLGVAIGDALGMPVEIKTPQEILNEYGRITTYRKSLRRGWESKKAGTTTDDTQLTLAVSRGMLEGGTCIHEQIKQHLKAQAESEEGWGVTTREALRKLSMGCDPNKSGTFDNQQLGHGNGILMKMAPALVFEKVTGKAAKEFLRKLTIMSHNTEEALDSTEIYYAIFKYCLNTQAYDNNELLELLVKTYKSNSMLPLVKRAFQQTNFAADVAEIGGTGKARFSCRHSLPLSLYCFINNPHDIGSLYDAVSAGGDTDTNASIVGALLGAVNGTKVFPKHLINGLDTICYDAVMSHANAWVGIA